MAEKIWKKFERDLKKLVNNIDNSVLKKLKTSFLITPLEYLTSDECELIIRDTIDKITYNKMKIYIHLLDFKKCLKNALKLKRKCPIESDVEAKRRKLADEEDNIENFLVKVKDEEEEFLDYYNGCTTSTTCEVPKVDENQLRIDKYIAKLENVLQATQVQIERLEEEELTLDDLDQENNSFIMLDKLKAHCVKVWRKICKLTKTSHKLRRKNLSKFSFKGTIYPNLNIIVEDFVKKKKFPDYNDIKTLVLTFVMDKSMKMSAQKVSELSVDIFTQIGNKLKKLRIGEFVNYFGNHLTDKVKANENPILMDNELKKVLVRNYALGQLKMDEILDKYSKHEHEKDDDNVSDISTEHSANSDNDDLDDNLEDINLETLTHATNHENLGIATINELGEDDDDDDDEEEEEISNVVEPINTLTNGQRLTLTSTSSTITETTPIFATVNSDTINNETNNSSIIALRCVSNNDYDAIIVSQTDQLMTQQINMEQQLKDMAAHTFKFNIEQIRHGQQSSHYPATITIDSSDSSDSESSEERVYGDDNHFAYSSKLDDFCVVKRKTTEMIDTGIVISIEDSDDDDN